MKKRMPLAILAFFVSLIASIYYMAFLLSTLQKVSITSYNFINIIKFMWNSPKGLNLFGLCLCISVLAVFIVMTWNSQGYKSAQIKVTDTISTPAVAGEGQCGTAKWLNKTEFEKCFDHYKLDLKLFQEWMKHNLDDIKGIESEEMHLLDVSIDNGGIVLGKKDKKGQETIFYVGDDSHVLVIGATRCGKGRTVILPTICTIGMSGESMVLTDPKGELYCYTSYFLKNLGYGIITIDFKNPKKSMHYNYLQAIINAVDEGDLPAAINYTWDITAQLVGEAKGEKLWNNGEASIIAACTISVVYDNREGENRKFQNMTNVFYFISQMCTPITIGKNTVVPLNQYMNDLPEDHPAKVLLSVGEIAPSRTRGSFYTSALMTLRLFSSPYIAEMTSKSDYNPMDIGKKKMAVFIILPDDKETYYELATLYVSQLYQFLSESANMKGGRLEKRVNFILDELGNFSKIANITSMTTVGAGKGIRLNFFLQDMAQMDAKYERDNAKTIRGNCDTWIYLKSNDIDTNELMSKKLGKYTTQTYSLSSSNQKYGSSTSGNNVSLMGRELLTSDEIGRIRRPYTLVTSSHDPAMFYAPDLCSWNFNKLLGMGSKKHNIKIMEKREKLRPERTTIGSPELWGIWNVYRDAIINKQKKQQIQEQNEMIAQMMGNMNF